MAFLKASRVRHSWDKSRSWVVSNRASGGAVIPLHSLKYIYKTSTPIKLTFMAPTPIRPVGYLERWSTVRHKLGYHNSVSLTATTSAPFVPITAFAALKECIKTHAVLSVTILDASTLARVECIDVCDLVTWEVSTDRTLEEVLAAEASTGFTEGSVAWRLRILRETTVVLSWCHGILDGESGVMVMRTFLSSLGSSSSSSTAISPPTLPLSPPVEELLSLTVSWSLLLKKGLELFLPWQRWLWTGPRISVVPANTNILLLRFPAAMLRKRCREEETSITALIHAAIGVSILRLSGGIGIAGSIAISLRRFLTDVAVLGVMAASVPHSHLPGEEGVWERAREVKETISRRLTAGTGDLNIALLQYVGDLYSFLRGREGKERELGYGVSNLGMVDIEGVESLVFSQSASVAGNALDVGIIGGGGEVCISFEWLEGVLENEFVEAVSEGIKEVVEEAVGPELWK